MEEFILQIDDFLTLIVFEKEVDEEEIEKLVNDFRLDDEDKDYEEELFKAIESKFEVKEMFFLNNIKVLKGE